VALAPFSFFTTFVLMKASELLYLKLAVAQLTAMEKILAKHFPEAWQDYLAEMSPMVHGIFRTFHGLTKNPSGSLPMSELEDLRRTAFAYYQVPDDEPQQDVPDPD
jgi:hypothetical protein